MFLRRGENPSTRRKTSRSRVENQQTQPTYDAESGNTLVGGECSHHCVIPALRNVKYHCFNVIIPRSSQVVLNVAKIGLTCRLVAPILKYMFFCCCSWQLSWVELRSQSWNVLLWWPIPQTCLLQQEKLQFTLVYYCMKSEPHSAPKCRSLSLALARRFTVLSKFRIRVPPNYGQSDWAGWPQRLWFV